MTEIASFNVKTRGPGGGGRTATFAVHDDGTVTRKITSVDGRRRRLQAHPDPPHE